MYNHVNAVLLTHGSSKFARVDLLTICEDSCLDRCSVAIMLGYLTDVNGPVSDEIPIWDENNEYGLFEAVIRQGPVTKYPVNFLPLNSAS